LAENCSILSQTCSIVVQIASAEYSSHFVKSPHIGQLSVIAQPILRDRGRLCAAMPRNSTQVLIQHLASFSITDKSPSHGAGGGLPPVCTLTTISIGHGRSPKHFTDLDCPIRRPTWGFHLNKEIQVAI
jgi:hypothetical protein